MKFLLVFSAAYILDLIIGDPEYRLHPIRIIGDLIKILEDKFYKFKNKKIGGLFLLLTSVTAVFTISYFLGKISIFLEIFFLYTSFATKSLGDSGNTVYSILKNSNIEEAKKKLSYLVTRNTDKMGKEDIVKSTIETMSENTVDGIVSPLFFALIGSFFQIDSTNLALPFAMSYKCVSTLDSMVGYKNEKYYDFGFFSAKCDDLLNFIPARITGGVLIPFSSFLLNYNWKDSFLIFLRDRKKHESPNSACSEAAFAGALNIYFGGNIVYFGEVVKKEIIGNITKEIEIENIKKAVKLLYITSINFFILSLIIRSILV